MAQTDKLLPGNDDILQILAKVTNTEDRNPPWRDVNERESIRIGRRILDLVQLADSVMMPSDAQACRRGEGAMNRNTEPVKVPCDELYADQVDALRVAEAFNADIPVTEAEKEAWSELEKRQ